MCVCVCVSTLQAMDEIRHENVLGCLGAQQMEYPHMDGSPATPVIVVELQLVNPVCVVRGWQ